ncbi:MAG: extracellular solute-binding protein [Magnetospirillum sp.]|nr:extracellular solute-binding protein [Magnetospirillum sp.]
MLNRRKMLKGAAAAATAATFLPKTVYAQTRTRKITFLTWNIVDQETMFRGWISRFTQARPRTEVEWIDVKGPEFAPYYQTQLTAGTPPDVINTQGALGLEYAAQGALMDLTPLLARESDVRQRFNADYLGNWNFEGKNFMFPFYITKTLMFYNVRMMRAAGLNRPPANFDEILAYAKAMSGGDRTGLMTLNFDWLYWPFFRMQGVDLLSADLRTATFNTPAGIDVADKLARATADGSINRISWTGRWIEPNGAFAAGNVGMLHAHSPAYFFFKGQGPWVNEESVDAGHAPDGWATPNSHGLGISRGTKEPELAWDFLKFVTDRAQASELGVNRRLMTGNLEVDRTNLAAFERESPLVGKILRTQIERTERMTGNWRLGNDTAVKNAVWPEMQNVFLGRRDARSALAEAERRIARELRRTG